MNLSSQQIKIYVSDFFNYVVTATWGYYAILCFNPIDYFFTSLFVWFMGRPGGVDAKGLIKWFF